MCIHKRALQTSKFYDRIEKGGYSILMSHENNHTVIRSSSLHKMSTPYTGTKTILDANIVETLGRFEQQISAMRAQMNGLCEMVNTESTPSVTLDNSIEQAELNAVKLFDGIVEGVASDMAKRYRDYVKIGKDEDGHPIYKWVEGKNKQDLFLNIARVFIDHGYFDMAAADNVQIVAQSQEDQTQYLFQPYTEDWKKRYKDSILKPNTLSGYDSALDRHLYPAFGHMDIREISINCVQDFLNSKSDRYVEETIEGWLVKLRSILNSAMEDGIITTNPAKSSRLIIKTTKISKQRDALTEEQVADIIAHLPDLQGDDRLYVAIPLFTGTRRGETLGLRYCDIDFDKNVIHIRNNVTYPRTNDGIIGTPKTKDSTRDVPMLPILKNYILETKQGRSDNAFIIGGEETPIKYRASRAMWDRIKKTIEVYGIVLHNFRHTFITMLTRQGVQESTLQSIGGYGDLRTMRKTYTHTQQSDLDRAAEQMIGAFVSG